MSRRDMALIVCVSVLASASYMVFSQALFYLSAI